MCHFPNGLEFDSLFYNRTRPDRPPRPLAIGAPGIRPCVKAASGGHRRRPTPRGPPSGSGVRWNNGTACASFRSNLPRRRARNPPDAVSSRGSER